ncbi:hypothetical protein CEXT_356751 [Caerostris extrusa]|uniref:Uncharacterized protein n=1 Tax=Caerostris extrusa TaxID=172846 RepID=A0AAV4Y8M5_CAEEX|nr:hypothetical protein CEXT_356751 [Caerostris extrusa]
MVQAASGLSWPTASAFPYTTTPWTLLLKLSQQQPRQTSMLSTISCRQIIFNSLFSNQIQKHNTAQASDLNKSSFQTKIKAFSPNFYPSQDCVSPLRTLLPSARGQFLILVDLCSNPIITVP